MKRQQLWDGKRQENYWAATESKARKNSAQKNGEHIAKNLDGIWDDLPEEERQFIEFLVLSGKRTCVALFEEDLFARLASKGLLQVPQGVGTLLMQQYRTTYSIPKTVWEYLLDKNPRLTALRGQSEAQRLHSLSKIFDGRIEALFEDAPVESDGC